MLRSAILGSSRYMEAFDKKQGSLDRALAATVSDPTTVDLFLAMGYVKQQLGRPRNPAW